MLTLDSAPSHAEILFSSDDQYLVVGLEDIKVFSIPDLALLRTFKKSGGDVCTCIAMSHDQRYLAVGFKKSILIGEIETGCWIDRLEGHDKAVRSLAFSHHGKELISASDDGTIRYWDAEDWEVRRLNKKEEITVGDIAVSADGKWLAMAHGTMVSLWSIAHWQKLCSFEGDKWLVESLAFSADSQYLAFAGRFSHAVSLFYVSEFLKTGKHQVELFSADYHHHHDVVNKSSDGEIINYHEVRFTEKTYKHEMGGPIRINAEAQTIPGGNIVNFWKGYLNEKFGEVNLAPGYRINKVMFAGQFLVAKNSDGSLHAWNDVANLKESNQQQSYRCTSSFSTQIPYTPNLNVDRVFASSLRVVISDSGSIISRPANQQILSVTRVKKSGLGHYKLDDLQTRPEFELFDMGNGSSERLKINNIYGIVADVAFTLDGQFLAITHDKVILLWSLASQKFVKTLKGHDENVTKLAFSQNYLISSDKNEMMLWNTKSGNIEDLQCVYTISKLPEIKSIDCVGNNLGLFFVTSHKDGVVRYWKIEDSPLRCILQWASDQQALMLSGMQVVSTNGLDSKQSILLQQQGALFENKDTLNKRQLSINLLTNNSYESKQAIKVSKPFEQWRDWELDRAASIFIQRGHAKSNLYLCAEAIEEYSQALFADPNNAEALLYRAYARYDIGLYIEAMEDCDQILKLNAKQEFVLSARCLRGDMKRIFGCYQEAVADYQQVLQIDSEYQYLHSKKSIAEACLGHFEMALSDSECALALESGTVSSILLGRSAVVLAFLNRAQTAKQRLDIMKRNSGEVGFTKYFEGWVYLLLGEYQKAIDCFNDVEKTQATMNDFYYMASNYALRGLAYFRIGNIKLALIDLEKALNYIPNHKEWEVWYQACQQQAPLSMTTLTKDSMPLSTGQLLSQPTHDKNLVKAKEVTEANPNPSTEEPKNVHHLPQGLFQPIPISTSKLLESSTSPQPPKQALVVPSVFQAPIQQSTIEKETYPPFDANNIPLAVKNGTQVYKGHTFPCDEMIKFAIWKTESYMYSSKGCFLYLVSFNEKPNKSTLDRQKYTQKYKPLLIQHEKSVWIYGDDINGYTKLLQFLPDKPHLWNGINFGTPQDQTPCIPWNNTKDYMYKEQLDKLFWEIRLAEICFSGGNQIQTPHLTACDNYTISAGLYCYVRKYKMRSWYSSGSLSDSEKVKNVKLFKELLKAKEAIFKPYRTGEISQIDKNVIFEPQSIGKDVQEQKREICRLQ